MLAISRAVSKSKLENKIWFRRCESVRSNSPARSQCGEVGAVEGKGILLMKESEYMDQETRWLTRYNEVKAFIEEHHRNPSKYYPEEKLMVHFLKRGRKLMNAGDLKAERLEKFKELLEIVEENKRKNQYV